MALTMHIFRQRFPCCGYILSFSAEQCSKSPWVIRFVYRCICPGFGRPVHAVVSLVNELWAVLGEEVWANLVKMRDFLSESVLHQSGWVLSPTQTHTHTHTALRCCCVCVCVSVCVCVCARVHACVYMCVSLACYHTLCLIPVSLPHALHVCVPVRVSAWGTCACTVTVAAPCHRPFNQSTAGLFWSQINCVCVCVCVCVSFSVVFLKECNVEINLEWSSVIRFFRFLLFKLNSCEKLCKAASGDAYAHNSWMGLGF